MANQELIWGLFGMWGIVWALQAHILSCRHRKSYTSEWQSSDFMDTAID